MISRRWNEGLLLCVLFLMGLGLVQVYSTSFIFATEVSKDGMVFFRKQLIFTILAFAALLFTANLSWKWAKVWGWTCFGISIVGLLLTSVPGVGVTIGGATRWLQLPFGFRFEPSELFKVSFPFLLAWLLVDRKQRFGVLEYPVRIGLIVLPLLVLLKQPDFGSFAICIAVGLMLWFAYGLPWSYLLAAAFISVPAFFYLVVQVPYRMERIQAFLDPWSDPTHKGFQVIQSMLSFHSGGLLGVGLGQGQGKLFFLPEAHTDFTLAVLGEEMGFLGFLLVLSLYGFIVFRTLQISIQTKDLDQRAIALGLGVIFALQVFINMGVSMGLLPPKGLTLPFMSYGGSSLVCSGLAMGWVLNLDRQLKERKSWQR